MFREWLLFMLFGHILGDFYTQTSLIARNKSSNLKWVLLHSLIYFITFLLIGIPIFTMEVLALVIMASLCHGIVDVLKYLYIRFQARENAVVFLVDQGMHIICIMALAYIWTKNNYMLKELRMISDFFTIADISEKLMCKWILGLLVIYKPANIFIQILIGEYKPKISSGQSKLDNKAGRKIGVIERFIILIMLYLNQYSAIGLVLTAKSIARYDRIAKDKDFAEYYLLGTLISMGITVGCTVLLF